MWCTLERGGGCFLTVEGGWLRPERWAALKVVVVVVGMAIFLALFDLSRREGGSQRRKLMVHAPARVVL